LSIGVSYVFRTREKVEAATAAVDGPSTT
jgi:hypothetical protein